MRADELPSWYRGEGKPADPRQHGAPASVEAELKAGNFGVVRSLLRALPQGMEAKALLDRVIDACRCDPSLLACLPS